MKGRPFFASIFFVTFLLVGTVAYAQTTSATSSTIDTQAIIKVLQDQIKALVAEIEQLKAQLESTKQEVAVIRTELKISRFLERGVTGDDVRQLQEFLSQFPDIYPEGLVTGYYGAKTEAAIRKLQEQNGIESIGAVGPKTLAAINALITEGVGGSNVPPPASPTTTQNQPATTPVQQATPTTTTPVRDMAPFRSNGLPFDVLSATTTSTKVSLTTNVAARCYWSNIPNASFDEMGTPFTTTGEMSHSMVISVSPGSTYSFFVKCRNQAFNTNTSDYPILFSVPGIIYGTDNTPPRVFINFPTNGGSITEGNATVAASASDDIGVVGVQFYLNSQKLNAEDVGAPFTATTTLAIGTYTLSAVARDLAGNRATSTAVTFYVKAKTTTTTTTATSATSATSTTSTTSSTQSTPSGNTSAGTAQTNTTSNTNSTSNATTSTSTTTTTTTTTPTPAPISTTPITVTYPNGGETWGNFNYNLHFTSNGINRFGFKLLKGSQIVYETPSAFSLDTPLSYPLNPPYIANLSVDSSGVYTIGFPILGTLLSVTSGSDYKMRFYDWDHPEVYDDSNDYFSFDVGYPVISSFSASSVTANSAVITWTTDKLATGYINYGSDPSPYMDWAITPTATAYTTQHSFTLSNLKSNTLYHTRLYSVDANGNANVEAGYSMANTPSSWAFTTLSDNGGGGSATTTASAVSRSNLAAVSEALKSLSALLQQIQQLITNVSM